MYALLPMGPLTEWGPGQNAPVAPPVRGRPWELAMCRFVFVTQISKCMKVKQLEANNQFYIGYWNFGNK